MQKQKKSRFVPLVALLAGIVFIAAVLILGNTFQSKDKYQDSVDFYFIEKDSSSLKAESRTVNGKDDLDLLQNVLSELKSGPKQEGLSAALPETVSIETVTLTDGSANIDVSKSYNTLKSGEELLCRGAIVWTLTDLDFVNSVSISVEGMPLEKANGEPIGKMTRDDIMLNTPISPEPTNFKTVTLYFSNEEATGLDVEERKIEVNPNEPLEKYIVEQLIKGPSEGTKLYATIPSETKIRDIKTVEGICYVDLSAEFVSKHSGGSTGETLTIYSIVNSLTELDTVKKVQFLIEGEKQEAFKGHIDFSKPFEYKDDIDA